jgi:hypothetical protein
LVPSSRFNKSRKIGIVWPFKTGDIGCPEISWTTTNLCSVTSQKWDCINDTDAGIHCDLDTGYNMWDILYSTREITLLHEHFCRVDVVEFRRNVFQVLSENVRFCYCLCVCELWYSFLLLLAMHYTVKLWYSFLVLLVIHYTVKLWYSFLVLLAIHYTVKLWYSFLVLLVIHYTVKLWYSFLVLLAIHYTVKLWTYLYSVKFLRWKESKKISIFKTIIWKFIHCDINGIFKRKGPHEYSYIYIYIYIYVTKKTKVIIFY